MFTNLKSWFAQNRFGAGVLALTAALAIGSFMLAGCTVTDWVSIKVPQQVRDATGAPATVTLTEAPQILEDYKRYGDRFVANIDAGNERLGWFVAVTDIGMRVGMAQLPLGGLGMMALTGIGGLFLKGPGTAREKEASYNKGKDEAEKLLLPLLLAAGVTVPPKAEGDA